MKDSKGGKIDKSKMKKDDGKFSSSTGQTQQPEDPILKEKILQLMDMTQCTQDNAILALHDSDNDINTAVNMLLESGNDMQGEWQEQKGKSKKKQASQKEEEEDVDNNRDAFTDLSDTKENRPYPRNAPPRFQRGGARRRDQRPREGDSTERHSGGFRGDRGRGRSRGGRGRGASRGGDRTRGGGFNRSGGDTGDQADAGTAIGTWTNESDANPKTDSWGDVWADEDNQWTGDLKGTHVFESTAKAAAVDAFPTPTEFDPNALAAQPTASPPPAVTSSLNGGSANSLPLDTSFPKQQVETLTPSSTALYKNQMASESIKNAIGIVSNSTSVAAVGDKQMAAGSQLTQPVLPPGPTGQSKNMKQLRTKIPPPSTKIPTAPVEMPHNSITTMGKLGVQFGALDFSIDNGLSLDSSPLTSSYQSVSAAERSSAPSASIKSSSSLYAASGSSHAGPEPIPFPDSSSTAQTSSQVQGSRASLPADMYSSSQGPQNNIYHSSTSNHFNSTSSTPHTNQQTASHTAPVSSTMSSHSHSTAGHNSQHPFQSNSRTASSNSNYHYPMTTESRGKGNYPPSGVQGTTTFTNSLYSSNDSSYQQYSSGSGSISHSIPSTMSSQTSSLTSSQTSQQISGNSSSRLSGNQPPTSKAPPNLPPPQHAPVMGVNYMLPGVTYYNQPLYSMEDFQKLQNIPPGYYDMPPYSMPVSTISSFSGSGAMENKLTRVDAQSPTVQGSQSQTQSQQQQQQQQSSSTGASVQHQQYMSLPHGYPGYYYHNMVNPYNMIPMPAVTQNMSIPGTNTTGGYQSQKTMSGSAGSSYYSGGAGYDDASHGSEFSKGVYAGSKQANNLSGSGSGSDIASMYKTNSGSQGGSAAMYGSQAAYMPGPHAANSAMMPQQHIMQSPESGMGSRGNQSAGIGKGFGKQQQLYNNWAN